MQRRRNQTRRESLSRLPSRCNTEEDEIRLRKRLHAEKNQKQREYTSKECRRRETTRSREYRSTYKTKSEHQLGLQPRTLLEIHKKQLKEKLVRTRSAPPSPLIECGFSSSNWRKMPYEKKKKRKLTNAFSIYGIHFSII